jgi:PAS domain S-box-containing protein
MARENGRFEEEGWRVRKDGSRFYANIVITALYDEQGLLRGYAKVTRDITEKQKAQRQLDLQNLQINQSNDAIFIVDRHIQITSWNQGAEKMYGYTKEEALGKNSNELLRLDISNTDLEQMLLSLENNNYWSGELKKKTKSNQVIYIRSSITNLRDQNGLCIGYVIVTHDITKQKELRAEVDYLANLVEQSNEAIISRDTDYRIRSWNRGAEKLFGFQWHETIGKTMMQIGFLKMSIEEINEFQKEADKYKIAVRETKNTRKDGSTFIGETSLSSIKNEKGEVVFYTAIIRDISERKRLLDELKKLNEALEQKVQERTQEVYNNEKRYRALIENSEDTIVLQNEAGHVIYRSPAGSRITGWTDEELFQSDNSKLIHPDDLPTAHKNHQYLHANPGKPLNVIYRFKHKKGHYVWLEGTAINLFDDKNVNGILFNLRDVSDRMIAQENLVNSEVRFRSLIENSAEAISLTDHENKTIYRSPSAFKILGYNSLGRIKDFAHPDDLATLESKRAMAFENPGLPIAFEGRFLHGSGEYIWLEGTQTNLLHVKGVEAIVTNFRDVTERVKGKAKLASSERRFRAMLENNADMVTLLDSSFRIIYKSPSASRITGWSSEEYINQYASFFAHPDFKEQADRNFGKLMANPGKSIHTSFMYRHKDGHYFWVEGIATNLLNDIDVQAIVLNLRDVSERKAVEEKAMQTLKELSDYKFVLDESSIVSISDEQGVITYANKNFCEINKRPASDLVGKDHRIVSSNFHPNAFFEELWSTIKKGNIWRGEIKNKASDGTLYWVHATIVPFMDDQGKPYQYMAIRTDITERKLAEEKLASSEKRFRALIENSSDAIVLNDEETNILYQSPSVTKILGYSPEERMGKKVMDFIHPNYRKDLLQLNKTISQTPNVPIPFQYLFQHKNGHYIWLEGVVTNLMDDPDVKAYVANYRDITERKEAETKIIKSEKKYREVIERISDGFLTMNLDWTITFINKIGEKLVNRKSDDLIGKNMKEEFPEAVGRPIFDSYEMAIKTKKKTNVKSFSPILGKWYDVSTFPSNTGLSIFYRDITDQMQAEELVRKSEEKYSTLIQRITDAFVSLDKDLCYTYLNKRAGEMINRNPDDLIGKYIWDVFPDSIGSPTYLGFQQAMKEQRYVYNIDYTPGIDLWHENHIYPSENGLSVFFRDITEKKRAEEKMHESNERFELASKATNDIIWDWNLINNEISWSENFYLHFGFDPKQTESTIISWEKRLHPDDKVRVIAGISETLEKKQNVWIDEYRFIKADGTLAYIRDCGYVLFDEKGKPYRIVGAMQDISNIKKAEEELKQSFDEKQALAERFSIILNTLPANIALLDNSGTILEVNQAWKKFGEENILDVFHYQVGDNYLQISNNNLGNDRLNSPLVASGIEAVLENKTNQFVYEYPWDTPSKKWWFRMIVTPIKGKIFSGAVVMHIDISELRRLEQERMKIKVEEQKNCRMRCLSGKKKKGVPLHKSCTTM